LMSDDWKDPRWQKKRLKIFERDGWKCFACGTADNTLCVHHKSYRGKPWDVPEDCLQTLCEQCHQMLGEHPKGGVWWYSEGTGTRIGVHHCPKCGCNEFKDKGSYIKCSQCGWDTGIYLDVGGFGTTENVRVHSGEIKKKPKEYSLKWLTGMMTKVRKGGASDTDIFQAVFPGSPLLEQVSMFSKLAKRIAERREEGCLTHVDEIAICEQLINARYRIEMVIEAGVTEQDLIDLLSVPGATDGTAQG
jgi:uncharacterized Zn finger protein (UPF0148 family)